MADPLLLWQRVEAGINGALERRQHYLDLFEQAPEPSFFTDWHLMVRAANGAAIRFFGKDPVGKPLAVFVPLAERTLFRQNVIGLKERGQWRCSAFSVDVRRSPGGLCWTLR